MRINRFLALASVAALVQAGAAQVTTFGGNPQHTGIYTTQSGASYLGLQTSSFTFDLNNEQYEYFKDEEAVLAHYGAPIFTVSNTMIYPQIGLDKSVTVFAEKNGTVWQAATGYMFPPNEGPVPGTWTVPYQPALTGARVYFAGPHGSVWYVNNPDAASTPTQVSAPAGLALPGGDVYIDTPLTAQNGLVYFGFRRFDSSNTLVDGGIACVDSSANYTYRLIASYNLPIPKGKSQTVPPAPYDGTVKFDASGSAPAIDGNGNVYVVVRNAVGPHPRADNYSGLYGYLLKLNPDLSPVAQNPSIQLNDPRSGDDNRPGQIYDISTASPVLVSTTGDVFIGIMGDERNPKLGSTYSRGFLLHLKSDQTGLTQPANFYPGGFGWDFCPAIVPASMVPSYTGTSPFLVVSKYQNYTPLQSGAGPGDGDGINRMAILDPNSWQIDQHPADVGIYEMREVMTLIGPTPDDDGYDLNKAPFADREWCINAPAVDPVTRTIIFPAEDGNLYRWDVVNNVISQAIALPVPLSSAYVPTVIGPDGTVWATNVEKLYSISNPNYQLCQTAYNSPMMQMSQPMNETQAYLGQGTAIPVTVTFNGNWSGIIPTGSVTFTDSGPGMGTPVTQTVQLSNTSPPTATYMLNVNSASSIDYLDLDQWQSGAHIIQVAYSGDGWFRPQSLLFVQRVHVTPTTTSASATVQGSGNAYTVSFTIPVTSSPVIQVSPVANPVPTGFVTVFDGNTAIASVPLVNGTATTPQVPIAAGNHTFTVKYASDVLCAASSYTFNYGVGPDKRRRKSKKVRSATTPHAPGANAMNPGRSHDKGDHRHSTKRVTAKRARA